MATTLKKFDLVIIGGGPAGITAAAAATAQKKTVAMIDCHHEIGGAGFNAGTVPSKALRETALAMSGLRTRKLAGVELTLRRETVISDFLRRDQNVRAIFEQAFKAGIGSSLAEVFPGRATFVDPHTVEVTLIDGRTDKPKDVDSLRLYGRNILIATGSSPMRPKVFPFERGSVYDSDTITKLRRVPKTLAVIGAGKVGSEYSCTFSSLGTEVHLIDVDDKLLPFLDTEIAQNLTLAMERSGVTFHWNEFIKQCEVASSGGVKLSLSSGLLMEVEAVLVATGRKCNSDNLNLAAAGVEANEFGVIPVDKHYRTNVAHIFAAGDVIGFPALASTSMEQARLAVKTAFGMAVSSTPALLPNGIYTIPEVGVIGQTEEILKQERIDYVVGRASYAQNARGQLIGDHHGFLKLLVRRDNMQVLGVHIMGDQATELVHIGLIAMQNGSTAVTLSETCFNIPTLGALYKSAAADAVAQIAESELGVPSFL